MAKLKQPKSKDDTPAEFSFFFRRIVGIAWLVINSGFVAWIISLVAKFGSVEPAAAIRALMSLGIALIVSNCFMGLLYYAGASAVDLGKIAQGIAQFRLRRSSYDYEGSYGEYPSPEPTPSKPDGE